DCGAVLRHLALRRHLLLEDRPHARLLPGGLGRADRVPAALLVPRARRGQEGRARGTRGGPGVALGDLEGAAVRRRPLSPPAMKLLHRQRELPEPDTVAVDCVLLASEGRPISPAALDLA